MMILLCESCVRRDVLEDRDAEYWTSDYVSSPPSCVLTVYTPHPLHPGSAPIVDTSSYCMISCVLACMLALVFIFCYSYDDCHFMFMTHAAVRDVRGVSTYILARISLGSRPPRAPVPCAF